MHLSKSEIIIAGPMFLSCHLADILETMDSGIVFWTLLDSSAPCPHEKVQFCVHFLVYFGLYVGCPVQGSESKTQIKSPSFPQCRCSMPCPPGGGGLLTQEMYAPARTPLATKHLINIVIMLVINVG